MNAQRCIEHGQNDISLIVFLILCGSFARTAPEWTDLVASDVSLTAVGISSLVARNEELGLQAVKQIQESNPQARDRVEFYPLDITHVESIRRLADHIKKAHGGLDILINNAAIAF